MSKIIRLNNETCNLIEKVRQNWKEEFSKTNKYEPIINMLDNDNIILQTALRTQLEFDIGFIESK